MKFFQAGLFNKGNKKLHLIALVVLIAMPAASFASSARPAETTSSENSSNFSYQQINDQLQAIAQRVLTGRATLEDNYMLATLARYSEDTAQLNEIIRLGALLDIQAGKFDRARADLLDLAENSSGEMMRFAREIAEILTICVDGEYTSSRSGETSSLSSHKTLRLAIIERAVTLISEGQDLLAEANSAAELKTDKSLSQAKTLYLEAFDKFLAADTLRGGCAKRQIISTATQAIKLLKSRTERYAAQFDASLKQIGKRKMQPTSYTKLLKTMAKCLLAVRSDLESIISLAQCDTDSFAVELQWAKGDLQRIIRMSETIDREIKQF